MIASRSSDHRVDRSTTKTLIVGCAVILLAVSRNVEFSFLSNSSLTRGELPFATREPWEFTTGAVKQMKARMLKVMSWMLGKRLRLTGHSVDLFKLDLVDQDDLTPGDQIAVFVDYNDYLSFLHHGIYIGNSSVIDVNNAGVHNISLTDFYGKEPLFKVNYHHWVKQKDPEEVIESALYFYHHQDEREEFSMVFGWNCETFATYCKTDVNATSQYADLVLTWIKTFANPIYDTALRLTQERYRGVFAKEQTIDDVADYQSAQSNNGYSKYSGAESSLITMIIAYICPHPAFFQ